MVRIEPVIIISTLLLASACGQSDSSGQGGGAAAPTVQTLTINGEARQIGTACAMWLGDWSLSVFLAANCEIPCKPEKFRRTQDGFDNSEIEPSAEAAPLCRHKETVTLIATAAVGTRMGPGVYGYGGDARRQVRIYPGARLSRSSGELASVLVDSAAIEGLEIVALDTNRVELRLATHDKLLRLAADRLIVPILPAATAPATLAASTTEVPARRSFDADIGSIELPIPPALAATHHWVYSAPQWHIVPLSEEAVYDSTEGVVLTLSFLNNDVTYDYTRYDTTCRGVPCRFAERLGAPTSTIRLPNVELVARLRGDSALGPASQATLEKLVAQLPLAELAAL